MADQEHVCQTSLRFISGGQTGADRAALDFAIEHGYQHGGWAPRGREAEDGTIPLKYQLTELTDGGYRQRNKRNVADSDGTLIVNTGVLDGGTLATQVFAQKQNKPYFLAQADTNTLSICHRFAWLKFADRPRGYSRLLSICIADYQCV